jgi:hypothetical protein
MPASSADSMPSAPPGAAMAMPPFTPMASIRWSDSALDSASGTARSQRASEAAKPGAKNSTGMGICSITQVPPFRGTAPR